MSGKYAKFLSGKYADFFSESYVYFLSGSYAYFLSGSYAYFLSGSYVDFLSGRYVYFFVAEAEIVEIKVESELKITSSPWNESLSDPSSDMFAEMKADIEEKMDIRRTDGYAEEKWAYM